MIKHSTHKEGSGPSEKYRSSPVVINRIKWCNQSSRINCWNTKTDQIKTPTLINTTVHSCCKGEIRTTTDAIPFWIVNFRLGAKRYQRFLCCSFELFGVISQAPLLNNLGYPNYFVKHLKSRHFAMVVKLNSTFLHPKNQNQILFCQGFPEKPIPSH